MATSLIRIYTHAVIILFFATKIRLDGTLTSRCCTIELNKEKNAIHRLEIIEIQNNRKLISCD